MLFLVLRMIVKLYIRVKFNIKVIGLENVPKKGSLIIASNHVSNYDPIILMCLLNRKVHFLAKQELFKFPITNWFFKKVHAIPVNRKTGIVIRAVRHSLSVLKEEKVLGIFPEGTRCKNSKKTKPKRGVGFFAYKSESPILPIALVGVEKEKGLRHPIKVVIGPIMKVDELVLMNYSKVAQLVMKEITDMKNLYEKDNNELPYITQFSK
ncbi:1-acyl-sn-glycerol-3-phosphate acyltransferase [Alkalihalobacillus sp. BA299]|uniref:lysophospholipid acyltransferase family protein n=1 Tax=Alkalihalobacillus sp. BA299 TaxID=2815938 RepID=UPI001ADCC5CF|nr:lysophospholipid acyltransferase family protein [Alkalihalobacillus sp. BA299]